MENLAKQILASRLKQLELIAARLEMSYDLYQDLAELMIDISDGDVLKSLNSRPEQMEEMLDGLINVDFSTIPEDEITPQYEISLRIVGAMSTILGDALLCAESKKLKSQCDKEEWEELSELSGRAQRFMKGDTLTMDLTLEGLKIHDWQAELLRSKDQEWYKEINSDKLQSPEKVNVKSAADPQKEFSDEDRIKTITAMITKCENTIIKTRLEQYNAIYAAHQLIARHYNMLMMKLFAGQRDQATSIKNYQRFNSIPKDTNSFLLINSTKRSEILKELTEAVTDMQLDFDNVTRILNEHQIAKWKAGEIPPGQTDESFIEAINFQADEWNKKKAEFAKFDGVVGMQKDIISRFKPPLAKLVGEVGVDEHEIVDREDTLRGIIREERKVCEATGCICVAREEIENVQLAGLGTTNRQFHDRERAKAILDGKAWKMKGESTEEYVERVKKTQAEEAVKFARKVDEITEAFKGQKIE